MKQFRLILHQRGKTDMLNSQSLQMDVRKALLNAGWSETRAVPIAQIVSKCEQAGFEATSDIQELLSNIYGINVNVGGRWLDFYPERVIAILNKDDVHFLERVIGEKLYPLGLASGSYLFYSRLGEVIFLDYDWQLYHCFSGVASLCNGILARDNNSISHSRQLALSERPEDFR